MKTRGMIYEMSDSNARAAFWTDALAPVAPKEEPEPDLTDMSFDDFAEYRKGRIKDMSNVRGIEADNPVARAREIAQMFQPKPMPDSMAEHAASRAANGVKDASDVFGASRPNPRCHRSPYSI